MLLAGAETRSTKLSQQVIVVPLANFLKMIPLVDPNLLKGSFSLEPNHLGSVENEDMRRLGSFKEVGVLVGVCPAIKEGF